MKTKIKCCNDDFVKVTKKIERISRGLAYASLDDIGFPMQKIHDKVDDTWFFYIEDAVKINNIINWTGDHLLHGGYSEEQLKKYKMLQRND